MNDVYAKTSDSRFNSKKSQDEVYRCLKAAVNITGFEEIHLLKRLDFDPNDHTIERAEAFLAELRAIFWLRNFGFTNIEPLQEQKKGKSPDLFAKYNKKDCVIEVFCLTQIHEQTRDDELGVFVNFNFEAPKPKVNRDFYTKAKCKKKQLDSTTADLKILLCVINSNPVSALSTYDEMQEGVKMLWETLGWGNGYYIGLLNGTDDCIYPTF